MVRVSSAEISEGGLVIQAVKEAFSKQQLRFG